MPWGYNSATTPKQTADVAGASTEVLLYFEIWLHLLDLCNVFLSFFRLFDTVYSTRHSSSCSPQRLTVIYTKVVSQQWHDHETEGSSHCCQLYQY